ncbi:hypothetical protein BDW59DRAFT_141735 [Aspergillus cavernicola]|uniref:Uncharacterized protein n=1 Tax=Aspergillus cavernicola TaxID=176166 RepID=A0ABR4IQY1_9EURO
MINWAVENGCQDRGKSSLNQQGCRLWGQRSLFSQGPWLARMFGSMGTLACASRSMNGSIMWRHCAWSSTPAGSWTGHPAARAGPGVHSVQQEPLAHGIQGICRWIAGNSSGGPSQNSPDIKYYKNIISCSLTPSCHYLFKWRYCGPTKDSTHGWSQDKMDEDEKDDIGRHGRGWKV